eukprot:gene24686-10316_t
MRGSKKETNQYNVPLLAPAPLRPSSPPGGYSLPVTNKQQTMKRPSPPRGARGTKAGTIAPGQPLPAGRQKDKFVPLPDDEDEEPAEKANPRYEQRMSPPSSLPYLSRPELTPHIFEDLPQMVMPPPLDTSRRGRITLYCLAESFDRKELDNLLRITYPGGSITSYPDCFYIEYGIVACWGMNKAQEMTVVRGLARQVQVQPLPDKEIEVDEFQYNFSVTAKPNVQNDTVTLHKRFAQDHKMKLAISYALAQSTKLLVYEKRVVDIVVFLQKNAVDLLSSVLDTPEFFWHAPDTSTSLFYQTQSHKQTDIYVNSAMQSYPQVFLPKSAVDLLSSVFLQKSAVNLLSSVLDTPEFFWHAPDMFTTLYNRLDEYLELPNRVELLNSRFTVLQEMLDMLRDHQNNYHSVRLEMVVIWLIVVEVVVGLFELLGLFGIVGEK